MPGTAIYYVDQGHGNDANDGLSWGSAKQTISGAAQIAADGDTILIGPGVYDEVITQNTALTYQAQQRWTVQLKAIVISASSVTLQGLYFKADSSGGSVIYNSGGDLTIDDCILQMSNTGQLLYTPYNLQMTKTVIYSSSTNAGYNYITFRDGTINACTIYDPGSSALIAVLGTTSCTISNCIFRKDSTKRYIEIQNSPTNLLLDYNCYWPAIASNRDVSINGTSYTSLASLQANGYETNGLEADPQFPEEEWPYLPIGSPLLSAGNNGRIGALPAAVLFSKNLNNWSDWLSTDCSYISQKWVLNDGVNEGHVDSQVIDVGTDYLMTGADISAIQTFPTHVVDATSSGVVPETQSFYIRGQDSATGSFQPTDATPSWQEININEDNLLGPWRYIQIRIVMRSDGI